MQLGWGLITVEFIRGTYNKKVRGGMGHKNVEEKVPVK